MANNQRSFWTLLVFVGLLVSFVIALSVTFSSSARFAKGPATQTGTTGPATSSGLEPPTAIAASGVDAPLLAAGDGKTLWLVHPAILDPTGKKIPAYELLARSSNVGAWTVIRDKSGNTYLSDHLRSLAMVSPPSGVKTHASAYVFGKQKGAVQVFNLDGESRLIDNLPPDHLLLAAAGTENALFALTVGAPAASTTRPGDVLNLRPSPSPRNSFVPPTTTRAQTAPASSEPATAPSAPAFVNAYWFHMHWTMLPPLGTAVATTSPASAPASPLPETASDNVPAAGALVTLACSGNRIIALWVNPANPNELVARSLDYRHNDTAWSPPVKSSLPENVPADSRLLPVMLDDALYLFWPVIAGGKLELHGGWLVTNSTPGADLKLLPRNILPSLVLNGAGERITSADVALGPTENSIAAIVNGSDNTLVSYLFSSRSASFRTDAGQDAGSAA